MKRTVMICSTLLLAALILIPVFSSAQVLGGDIYGSVVLADGSKVPGVLVTLTGLNIGKRTTISNEFGNFRFQSLPFGLYEARFELKGFKTVVRKDIELSLRGSVTLNILMGKATLKD